MIECLQDRRLLWFDHLEIMEENAWSGKCRWFNVSGKFHRKTWNEMIRGELKERKVRKSA